MIRQLSSVSAQQQCAALLAGHCVLTTHATALQHPPHHPVHRLQLLLLSYKPHTQKSIFLLLAVLFVQVGYHVTVRTAIGGGPSCFRNLRHEFLTVLSNEGDFKDCTLIVDPLFREQFAIPQPSATYEALLELVPLEFVGTASRLIPLVQCLCAEMVASFEANGLTLPPWRRAQSMLSKWLPTKSRDTAVPNSSVGSPSRCSSGSAAATAVAGTSCESDSGSLELSAAGGSPFSRISDVDLADRVVRQSSSRSLLSGKLSNSAAARNTGVMANTANSSSSRLGMAMGGAAAAQAVGTVSMQPPVYKGQPPTYRVKIASAAALLQQQQLPRRQ
jgi:uncharacterized protein (TIGR01615 family)